MRWKMVKLFQPPQILFFSHEFDSVLALKSFKANHFKSKRLANLKNYELVKSFGFMESNNNYYSDSLLPFLKRFRARFLFFFLSITRTCCFSKPGKEDIASLAAANARIWEHRLDNVEKSRNEYRYEMITFFSYQFKKLGVTVSISCLWMVETIKFSRWLKSMTIVLYFVK